VPRSLTIPWRMWYGREALALDWPEGWEVDVRPMADAPALSDEEVAALLAQPDGSPPLAELARGRRDCCILVDDLTRPTPASRIVPHLLRELRAAGIADEDVTFVVANAVHGALKRPALDKKLGPEVCDRFVVMRHDAHRNLVPVGDVPGIGEVLVNRFVHAADLKVAVTGVMPHFMCGFSGGAKIVMPGACGLETVARTHEHTVEGPPARVGVVEGNAMRRLMEECAARVGLEFCVNCVFNSEGALSALSCGAPGPSHAVAVAEARRTYATDVLYGADVAVFNAFPKDTEFIQAMAALNVWADRGDAGRALVRPGGSIVAITACSEGLGVHGLIEYGRRQFVRRDRHGSFRGMLAGRNLLLLAPNVSTSTVHLYYPPEALHFREWGPLRRALEAFHPQGARVAVYPTSALQLDRAALALTGQGT